MTAEIRQLQAAARELFTSRSLMEAGEAILANAQVLMHADAHAFYDFLRTNRPDSVVLIEMRLDLLDRCRDADIRKAIADYEPLFDLWNEILQARAHQASERDGAHEIVQPCERALERVRLGRTEHPRVCGWLLTVLAEALLHDPHGSRVDNTELALIHLRTCADWLPPLSEFQQAEVYRLLGDVSAASPG